MPVYENGPVTVHYERKLRDRWYISPEERADYHAHREHEDEAQRVTQCINPF